MLHDKSLSSIASRTFDSPFERFVATALSVAPARDHQALFAVFVEGGGLTAQLAHILQSRQQSDAYAAGSYGHANGFDKILVGRSSGGAFHLRVHFWPGQDFEEQNVHDHRFEFWSYVLRGTIVSHVWRPCADGREFRRYTYEPRGSADSYVLKGHEMALLNIAGSETWPEGSVYAFGHHKLHRSEEHTSELQSH